MENIKTLLNSASLVYRAGDYTSATVLYFKAFFGILDLIILRNRGIGPKSHTERFRILQKDFPHYYEILDKYFPIYQQTYVTKIEREICDEIKKQVTELAQEQGIPE